MIDLLSYKALLWKAVENKRKPWEDKYTVYFRKVLNNEFTKLANSIDQSNCFDLDLPAKVMGAEPISRALTSLYYNVGRQFAENQYSSLRTRKSVFVKEEDIDWYEIFANYVRLYAGEKIISIVSGSRDYAKKIIREVLDETIEEGVGADETARRIRKRLRQGGVETSQWRALRIARTEVMSASNLGAIEGARATGLAMKKYWVATYDNRTRDTHMAVEQQNPKMMDEPFRVGNYDMMQPGDENGGAEEIINCRCAVTFEVL